jgi:hypothetical protein
LHEVEDAWIGFMKVLHKLFDFDKEFETSKTEF